MNKKNKKYMKCFKCGNPLNKEEAFRDDLNQPTCEDCMKEFLWDKWDDDFGEYVLDELKTKHDRKYKKFKKSIQECSKCGIWYDKKELQIDGVCDICKEKEIEREKKLQGEN